MQRTTNLVTRSLGVAVLVAFSASAAAAGLDPAGKRARSPAPRELSPPLVDWQVDQKGAIAEIDRQLYPNGRAASGKAAQDKASVYRPVPVCRLVDTRGFPAAVAIAGPLQPNTTTNVSTNGGACGIPSSGVVGLSVAVSIQNQTPNSGGFITLLQQGAPVTGVSAVLNFNTVWTATTANVSLPNASGDFAIHLNTATANVIIDVNGYFQDLNSLDVGTQEFDLFGTGTGQTFQFSNSGAGGTALTGGATGTNGIGFRLTNGRLAVTGADTINGSNAVFVHRVNASAAYDGVGVGTVCSTTGFLDFSMIDHPMTNNNPAATLFITARSGGSNGPLASEGGFEAYYLTSGCTNAAANNKWAVRSSANIDHATGDTFNVMIIDD